MQSEPSSDSRQNASLHLCLTHLTSSPCPRVRPAVFSCYNTEQSLSAVSASNSPSRAPSKLTANNRVLHAPSEALITASLFRREASRSPLPAAGQAVESRRGSQFPSGAGGRASGRNAPATGRVLPKSQN